MDLPYQVFNPSGEIVMQAPEGFRYPRQTELSLLDAGYTIKLCGKRITKAEIRKELGRKSESCMRSEVM